MFRGGICGRDATKLSRLSIAKVMAVVAAFAINMAALRSLHSYDEDLDQGIALAGFALQFGFSNQFAIVVGSGRSGVRGQDNCCEIGDS